MISDTGKHLYRALFLTARDAARWFVPRRVKFRKRESGWHPVALRWRKRGKKSTNLIIHRTAAATKVLSFPIFHFHFTTYQTQRASTTISGKSTSAIRVFETQLLRDEIHSSDQAPIVWRHDGGDHRVGNPSDRLIHSRTARRDFGPRQLPSSKSTSAHPTHSQLLQHRKRLFTAAITWRRSPTTQQEIALPLKPQSRIVPYGLPLAARSRNQINASLPPVRNNGSLPQTYRTEELVWRRVSKTTTDVTERVRQQETVDSAEAPSSHSLSTQQTAADVARMMEVVASTPITKLHPALMDRLADDVIRRVEQRVRIERERRGL